jgi:hypothetical protein
MTLALQVTGFTKRFPGVLANDHVNFPWKEACCSTTKRHSEIVSCIWSSALVG